jgi:radical SAM superfamily enzyme YgiQ (UPF0313 family)
MIPDCDVQILDLSVAEEPKPILIKILESKNWDVIGITVLTYCLDSVRQLVNLIRKNGDTHLIGGGAHATLVPDDCLKMGFDTVVVGEGELVISDIIHKEQMGIIKGEPVKNFEKIPFPDRRLVDHTKYGFFGFLQVPGLSTSVMISRGCPFNCRFCGRLVRGSVRRRSVESIIKELNELQRQGFENIFIADDHFITNRKWVIAFCEAVKKHKLSFNFFFQTRIDNFNLKIAKALRDIGTQYIGFGIESINPDILRYYNKTSNPLKWRDLTKKALEYCNDAGIFSQASLIIGAPMETEEMFWESYDFVRKNGADTVNVNPLTYLVGSEIWREAIEKGILQQDEYLISVLDRNLSLIPQKRIAEICDEVFEKVINVERRLVFKTVRHIDRFRIRLLSMGVKKAISWNLLRGNWREHYNILKEFGYGKKSKP